MQTTSSSLWQNIDTHTLRDQRKCLLELSEYDIDCPTLKSTIHQQTVALIETLRTGKNSVLSLEAFLHEYPLHTTEGAALMCLAESLLRIPDKAVARRLLHDRLTHADWRRGQGRSTSLFVNAASLALSLGETLIANDSQNAARTKTLGDVLLQLAARASEPFVLSVFRQAMKFIAGQFVFAETISEALQIVNSENHQLRHSFDMLGEESLGESDSIHYFQAYYDAITAIANAVNDQPSPGYSHPTIDRPGVSIKLSALHPRFEFGQRERVLSELGEKLTELCRHAARHQVPVTIDAEESSRLGLTLELYSQALSQVKGLTDQGTALCGLAVQAYSKRALPVLQWLQSIAKQYDVRLPVRLVKGAYWDSEIKWAQQQGLKDYPVFTDKTATDYSYLCCATLLLQHHNEFYPQFATHNAQTLCALVAMTEHKPASHFEFQRLHGMGEAVYEKVLKDNPRLHCRIYAPIGSHQELLPYLIRRLLENGANSSFVNQLSDPALSPDILAKYPELPESTAGIPLPCAIFAGRKNSSGLLFYSEQECTQLMRTVEKWQDHQWTAFPLLADDKTNGYACGASSDDHPLDNYHIHSPQQRDKIIGRCFNTNGELIRRALWQTRTAFRQHWRVSEAKLRATMLCRFADLLEEHRGELISLCCLETGKTLPDGLADLREAVDFARYYANECLRLFQSPQQLESITGEENRLALFGRGVFVCISPWNFPLAIFCGQITAALAAGNCVIAKPAEQSPLCAFRCVELLHQAGIPRDVLLFLPGAGDVGQQLCAATDIDGVAFTGSTVCAQHIQRTLAARGSEHGSQKTSAPLIPLIAETGGQNALLADSSALVQQLARDTIRSAFNSAGQRCSALRVLYVQQDIADSVIECLKGMMDQLVIGDPARLATDIGPVIDSDARQGLCSYLLSQQKAGKILHQCRIDPQTLAAGFYIPPTLIRCDSILELSEEHFGPILHIVSYPYEALPQVIRDIQRCPFGLTFGIHSRNEHFAQALAQQISIGNIYINRDIIGATVGSQPFGGQGLSGTGPKAGGPHYLLRFSSEVTVSINRSALGGNLHLLSDPQTD